MVVDFYFSPLPHSPIYVNNFFWQRVLVQAKAAEEVLTENPVLWTGPWKADRDGENVEATTS